VFFDLVLSDIFCINKLTDTENYQSEWHQMHYDVINENKQPQFLVSWHTLSLVLIAHPIRLAVIMSVSTIIIVVILQYMYIARKKNATFIICFTCRQNLNVIWPEKYMQNFFFWGDFLTESHNQDCLDLTKIHIPVLCSSSILYNLN
jgi:hypothetical protein